MEETMTMDDGYNIEAVKPQLKTKVCKVCGEEKPLMAFKNQKNGSRSNTCKTCTTAKRLETIRLHKMGGIANREQPFYDADFDGKQPVEVIQLMSRAKKWLESRGYEIILKGKYTITKEVKF